jgi:hypothetical protein
MRPAFPTLKRGDNERCASGALDTVDDFFCFAQSDYP